MPNALSTRHVNSVVAATVRVVRKKLISGKINFSGMGRCGAVGHRIAPAVDSMLSFEPILYLFAIDSGASGESISGCIWFLSNKLCWKQGAARRLEKIGGRQKLLGKKCRRRIKRTGGDEALIRGGEQ